MANRPDLHPGPACRLSETAISIAPALTAPLPDTCPSVAGPVARGPAASSGLSPLTQARTLLRLMQLDRTARRYVDANSADTPDTDLRAKDMPDAPPSGLSLRLAELITTLETTQRQALFDELADASWAEGALIAALCRLPLPGSARLIRYSPVLTDAQLIDLIGDNREPSPEDKAVLVAARRALPPSVADALIASGPSAPVAQLLHNRNLHLSEAQFLALAKRAKTDIAVRAPLASHPALTREAAAQLLNFVGPRLRETLTARFGVLYASDFSVPAPLDLGQSLHRLQKGDFSGFCAGLSRLTGLPADQLPPERLRHLLTKDSAVPLALVMVTVGLDRAALPDLAARIQALNDGHPRISAAHLRFARLVFDLSPSEARARLLTA